MFLSEGDIFLNLISLEYGQQSMNMASKRQQVEFLENPPHLDCPHYLRDQLMCQTNVRIVNDKFLNGL